jgi:predicted RNA-binding Zn-ribbon protein involved in translation (DUF1610 family)
VYEIIVGAIDAADNTISRTFTFTIKEIVIINVPEVVSTIPDDGDDEVAIGTDIIIEFSLSMDETSAEGAIVLSPDVNVAGYTWNSNSTIVTIDLEDDLDYSTEYTITIKTDAVDMLNIPLDSVVTFSFTTKIDTDDDDIPDDIDEDDDGDGMADLWEEANGFNSVDPADADLDADSDELTNFEEYLNNTDPKNSDSDADGLTDGAEIKTYDTKPKIADSDGDGYSDGDEVTGGTDPNDPDSNLDVKEPKEEESDSSMLMLAIIMVIVVILIVVLLFFIMKRRKKDEELPGEEEGEEVTEGEGREDFDCPECGAIVPGHELTCPECGAEFEPAEEQDSEVAEAEVGTEAESVEAEEDMYREDTEGESEFGEDIEAESEMVSETEMEAEESEETEEFGETEEIEESEDTDETEESEESEEEGEEFECPDCGASIGADATSCPSCGAEFE